MKGISSVVSGLAFVLLSLSSFCLYADVSDRILARQNYILNCQGCHLPDAMGAPGLVPRMNGFVGNFLHVEGGREFIVRVPGSANAPIDDGELADVLNWMLQKFSREELPADFKPYEASEVEIYRSNPLIDVNGTRAVLIERIQDKLGIKEDGLNDSQLQGYSSRRSMTR